MNKPTSYIVQYDNLTDCYIKIPQYSATNWGQRPRTIKIKKRNTISPYVLNLSLEAKQWEVLSKALRKRIRRLCS